MNQIPPTKGEPASAGRSAGLPGGLSIPSWVVSMLLHLAMLGGLGTISWTVSRALPEKEFSVGIVVKKNTPDGDVFETQDRSYEVPKPDATESAKFLSELEPSAVAESLPKLAEVDPSQIGLSGSMLTGSELLAVPDSGVGAGMVNVPFFGAQAWGSKFVFVIDRSGSMSERDRLGEAKRELLASLSKLPATTQFQIIFYNLEVKVMPVGGSSVRLLPASDQNKTLARRYLDTMAPDGGTEHGPALRKAIALGPDVIFFLTDADDLRERDVKEATELNKGRARIHTIDFSVGPEVERQTTLRDLAAKNGGTYRYVDVSKLGRSTEKGGR